MANNNNEAQAKSAVSGKRKNPCAASKICEFMTYAGKEAFKRLRTNLLLAFPEENAKCKVIGVTSAQVSEGKSTVSINLAYSLAELGKKVLLIDGDLRRPSIHEKIGMFLSPGLSDVILGTQELGQTVNTYHSSTDGTHFNVISSGSIPSNPSELLTSARFEMFINTVASACDYVIIDLPPVNAVVDAVGVSSYTDGMIVVIRENHCPKYVLNECVDQLLYAKANILGFVMNGCTEGAGKHYHYNSSYYQRYYK